MVTKEKLNAILDEVKALKDSVGYLYNELYAMATPGVYLDNGEQPEDYLKSIFKHVRVDWETVTPTRLGYDVNIEVGDEKVKVWVRFRVFVDEEFGGPWAMDAPEVWDARAKGEWVNMEADSLYELFYQLEELEVELYDELENLEKEQEEKEEV